MTWQESGNNWAGSILQEAWSSWHVETNLSSWAQATQDPLAWAQPTGLTSAHKGLIGLSSGNTGLIQGHATGAAWQGMSCGPRLGLPSRTCRWCTMHTMWRSWGWARHTPSKACTREQHSQEPCFLLEAGSTPPSYNPTNDKAGPDEELTRLQSSIASDRPASKYKDPV